jgi:hypothetical protein
MPVSSNTSGYSSIQQLAGTVNSTLESGETVNVANLTCLNQPKIKWLVNGYPYIGYVVDFILINYTESPGEVASNNPRLGGLFGYVANIQGPSS